MKTLSGPLSLCLVVLWISLGASPQAVASQDQVAIDAAVELRNLFLPHLPREVESARAFNSKTVGTKLSVQIKTPSDRVYTNGWEGAEIPSTPGFADLRCQAKALEQVSNFQRRLSRDDSKKVSNIEIQLVHVFEHPLLKYFASCASPSNRVHLFAGKDAAQWLCLGLLPEAEKLAEPVKTNGTMIVRAVSVVSGLTDPYTKHVVWHRSCVVPTSDDLLIVNDENLQRPLVDAAAASLTKLMLSTGVVSAPQPPVHSALRFVP
jgi:hypothetical protein